MARLRRRTPGGFAGCTAWAPRETKNPLSNEAKRVKGGGQTRNRTEDTRIFSPLLYQLSYLAQSGMANKGRLFGGVNGKFKDNRTGARTVLLAEPPTRGNVLSGGPGQSAAFGAVRFSPAPLVRFALDPEAEVGPQIGCRILAAEGGLSLRA